MAEDKNQQNNNQTPIMPSKESSTEVPIKTDQNRAKENALLDSTKDQQTKPLQKGFQPNLAEQTLPPENVENKISSESKSNAGLSNYDMAPGQGRKVVIETKKVSGKTPNGLAQKDPEQKDKLEQPNQSSIRTYAGDIASLIKKEDVTLSKVALSEQKRKIKDEESAKTAIPRKRVIKGNRKLLIFSLIFIILGITAVSTVFLFRDGKKNISQLEIPSLVFANTNTEIAVTGLKRIELLKKINEGRTLAEGSLGSITNLYLTTEDPTKRLLGGREFLEKIEARARGSFIRALSTKFMLGAHSFDGNQAFLIFEVDSFSNALSGALDWEGVMLDDLWPVFYTNKPSVGLIEEESATSTTATSTNSGAFIQRKFEDRVIKSKDVRILENEEGVVLIYSFPDKEHLIITTDRATFAEVLSRLTTDRFRN